MKNLFLLLITILVLSACSFNKMYLHPYAIECPATHKFLEKASQDTLLFRWAEKTATPEFRYLSDSTKEVGFTIANHFIGKGNGEKLHAWFFQPKDSSQIKATILLLHGNAGNVIYQMGSVLPFLDKGFRILLVDYSGFGFSEGKSTRKNVLKDGRLALDYLYEFNKASKLPLIVYGQSLGGHLSAVVAAEQRDKVDALVIEGAFSSHDDVAADMTKMGFIARLAVKEQYSAKKEIGKFAKPLLIIHSHEDKTIPFYMGERLFDAASEPKHLYAIEHCHICGPRYYADSIAVKMQQLTLKPQ